ncbi:hypothetical protein H6G64_04050 [Calothrix sp. FACHB-156]|nr:hypothetical protein [Calothrix sp. FACHB-156]
MALVSTFEVLLKPQLPPVKGLENLSRKVIQGYFLTIANVNFFPVTLSLVFTVKFPSDPGNPTALPKNFDDFLEAVDISGVNIISNSSLVPEKVPQNNKARLTFTIPENGTSLLLLQPDITKAAVTSGANFEARGYVEIFLSSLSGSDSATLLVTPEHRGTFFKDLTSNNPDKIALDQIAYALPVSNGGIFKLSNQ